MVSPRAPGKQRGPVIHTRGSLVVAGMVVVLLLAWWMMTHTPSVGCEKLPPHGPSGTLSMSIARDAHQSGSVCVRVYNGTDQMLSYGPTAFSLQESWLWVLWLPYWNGSDLLKHLFSVSPKMAVIMIRRRLPVGGRTDWYLPFSPFGRSPAPSGWYRVCFDYRVGATRKEQRVYSAPFWLP